MKDRWIGRVRATPSGTRVVLVVLTVLVISTVGRTIARWEELTHGPWTTAGAVLSMLVPFAALLWGVRSASRAADARREPVARR